MLETAPIEAAVAAIRGVLLNICEKPKTPTKLMASRSSARTSGSSATPCRSSGVKPARVATTQPVKVAVVMMTRA